MLMRADSKWTREETERLVSLYVTENTRAHIASLLGRTEKAIKEKAKRLKLRKGYPGRWSEEEDALLRELWPTDIPTSTVIERIGRTHAGVLNRAKVLELRRPLTIPTAKWHGHDAKLRELVAAGLSSAMIAKELGTTRAAVIGRVHRLKLKLLGIHIKRQARKRINKPRQYKSRQQRRPRPERSRPNPLPHRLPQIAAQPQPAKPLASLLSRTPKQCAFIVKDGGFDDLTMCGGSVVYRSYCGHHARLSYTARRVQQ